MFHFSGEKLFRSVWWLYVFAAMFGLAYIKELIDFSLPYLAQVEDPYIRGNLFMGGLIAYILLVAVLPALVIYCVTKRYFKAR